MTTMPTLRRALIILAGTASLLLAGCSDQELYGSLTERQANEMVAALRVAGIDSDKSVKDGRFTVTTAKSDFSRAIRVLESQGLPREAFDTMGKVFKREGFVSTPLEERARLNHAMSQEISNTLANIDGVVTARVHLVVPERNPLIDKPQPAAASVFIKHRPDKDLSGQVAQIKALVVNSIEGLSYDNVTVALFPAEASPGDVAKPARPATETVTSRSESLEAPLLSGGLLGAVALGGGGLMWWRRRSTPRRDALPAPDGRPALPDGSERKEPR